MPGSREQPAKSESPMEVRELGSATDVRRKQLENVPPLRAVIPDGITMLVSRAQPENVEPPRLVRFAGSMILVRLVQEPKAAMSMVERLLGSDTELSAVHFENAE